MQTQAAQAVAILGPTLVPLLVAVFRFVEANRAAALVTVMEPTQELAKVPKKEPEINRKSKWLLEEAWLYDM